MNIEFTIDRIENNKAVLKSDDGMTIAWPVDRLPSGAKEGAVFLFNIKGDKEKEIDKREFAKNILNEILEV